MKKILLGITAACLCLSSFESSGIGKIREWRAKRQEASYERKKARDLNVNEAVNKNDITVLNEWFTTFENNLNQILQCVDQLSNVTAAHFKAEGITVIDSIRLNKKNVNQAFNDAKQIFYAINRGISGTEWNKASAAVAKLNLDTIVKMLTDINNLIETTNSIDWGNINTKKQASYNKLASASEVAAGNLEDAIRMYNDNNRYLSEAMSAGSEDLLIVIKGCQTALSKLVTCIKNAQKYGIKTSNVISVLEREKEERIKLVGDALSALESAVAEMNAHTRTLRIPEVKQANNQQAMVVKHFIEKIYQAKRAASELNQTASMSHQIADNDYGMYLDYSADQDDSSVEDRAAVSSAMPRVAQPQNAVVRYQVGGNRAAVSSAMPRVAQPQNAVVRYQGQSAVGEDPSTGTVPQKVDRIERRIAAQRRVVGR